jgi:hypothetical protein
VQELPLLGDDRGTRPLPHAQLAMPLPKPSSEWCSRAPCRRAVARGGARGWPCPAPGRNGAALPSPVRASAAGRGSAPPVATPHVGGRPASSVESLGAPARGTHWGGGVVDPVARWRCDVSSWGCLRSCETGWPEGSSAYRCDRTPREMVRYGSFETPSASSLALPWSGRRDSNPRPSPWQGDALPTEPRPPGAHQV